MTLDQILDQILDDVVTGFNSVNHFQADYHEIRKAITEACDIHYKRGDYPFDPKGCMFKKASIKVAKDLERQRQHKEGY